MCLSTAFELRGEERQKICEHVSGIELTPGKIKLTDIMGGELEVAGRLQSIDLISNTILISAEN